MPEPAVRVGIIGLGRSGWNIHAAAIAEHPDFDVVAVADPVAERQAEAKNKFGCAVYDEPAGVIADSAVQVVVVASPSFTHVPLTIEALRAGRHVVVEKPMAESPAQIDVMTAAATAAGRVLTCYQPRRFDADFHVVQDLIASGRLGELVLIRRTIHRFSRRSDWQMLRKFGGGELSNTVAHTLDQVLQLIDEGPVELLADLRHTVGAGDAEDHVKLVLQGKAGPLVEVESSSVVAIPQDPWMLVGTAGMLVGNAKTLRLRWMEPSALPTLTVDEGPAAGRQYSSGEVIEWQDETIEVPAGRMPVLQFYDRLLLALRDGAPVPVTPESVRRQIELIERARKQTGYL